MENAAIMANNAGRDEDSASSSSHEPARGSSARPSTPKPSMKAVYPLGAVDCGVCKSRPTHRLTPCQHTVCYEHFLGGYDSESSFTSLCGTCYQTVSSVVEIADEGPSSVHTSSSLSPHGRNIWRVTSHVRATSLAERLFVPSKTPDTSLDAKMNPSSGPARRPTWSHAEFIPQTPASAPQTFPSRADRAHFTTPPQQSANSQAAFPQFVQPQFPHPQLIMQQRGAPQNANNHGWQFPQNSMQSPQPTGQHWPGYQINTTFPGSQGHNDDPFVDNSSMVRQQPPFGFAQPGPSAMHHQGDFSTPVSSNVSPGTAGEDHKTKAARLAAQIKSGMLEQSPDSGRASSARSRQQSTSSQQRVSEWTLQQPFQLIQQPAGPVARQMFATPDVAPDPPFLKALTQGYHPNADEVFDSLPLTEQYRTSQPSALGVVKIHNIPYGTTKNEIVAAVGRNARLVSQPVGTPFYAIHIIMERSTGKTMDCYVELESDAEATFTVNNYQHRCLTGRAPRIGDRHIEMEVSSQEALMKELFPRAKCVQWNGQSPTVYKTNEPFNSGFNGFLTGEEMVMVQKHAETPQRSPFAQRCHNRTYECLISTLHKYPWFAHGYVTLGERSLLFNSTIICLRALTLAIQKNSNPAALNRQLMQELLCAALTNNGFTPQQKSFICESVDASGFGDLVATVPFIYHGLVSKFWPFEVLVKKPEASMDCLNYYIGLLRDASTSPQDLYTMSQHAMIGDLVNPFGALVIKHGGKKEELTLIQAAMVEWNVVETAIRKALSGNPQQAAITYTAPRSLHTAGH